MVDLYEKRMCYICQGSGQEKIGEPLGSCDGPQYGKCSACNGTGSTFVHVELIVRDKK